jgi:hypothetical protein
MTDHDDTQPPPQPAAPPKATLANRGRRLFRQRCLITAVIIIDSSPAKRILALLQARREYSGWSSRSIARAPPMPDYGNRHDGCARSQARSKKKRVASSA